MSARAFGVSTHLFHDHRLTRDHLALVKSHGFDAVEVFATRSHFDYHDETSVNRLGDWLAELGLTLHSVHAPIMEAMRNGQWVGPLSTASGDEARRGAALAEIEAALAVARRLPFAYLVVHLGLPATEPAGPHENQPAAARRSVEAIAAMAADAGVQVALEVIPNALSRPDALVRLIEDDLEDHALGVCLDYGHAHLMGDVVEAIEALSGHLVTTHVHDNHGRRDEHVPPYDGSIDWEAAMMTTQKVGYDGILMFEVGGSGHPEAVLARAAGARARLSAGFIDF